MIREQGVDVSHILWVAEGRNGTIFMEIGQRPRPSEVIYDRANSAASKLRPDEVDWGILDEAKHLHVSGITPALSPSCSDCVSMAIDRARGAGLTVSFDVNYRRKLWEPRRAAEALSPLIAGVDVLFLTADDAETLFGVRENAEEAVRRVADRLGSKWTALTLGGEGAVGYAGGHVCLEPAHPTDAVDRIGAGDAFVGGFLYGFFRDDLKMALKYGLAMAALKMTTPGDLSYATLEQVRDMASGTHVAVKR
jgi:2-dehydro-3-deoxygluconokinase